MSAEAGPQKERFTYSIKEINDYAETISSTDQKMYCNANIHISHIKQEGIIFYPSCTRDTCKKGKIDQSGGK